MLVKCDFGNNYQNTSHNVTLVPRLEYSTNLLADLIIFLKKERKYVKNSNKAIFSRFDESEKEYQDAIEVERKITFTLEALYYIEKRIQSVSGIFSISEKLPSVIPMLRIVSAQIYENLPIGSQMLCEISVHLGSVIIDSATITQAKFDFGQFNDETTRILDEVKLIADSKIRKQHPNLDFSKQLVA